MTLLLAGSVLVGTFYLAFTVGYNLGWDARGETRKRNG